MFTHFREWVKSDFACGRAFEDPLAPVNDGGNGGWNGI